MTGLRVIAASDLFRLSPDAIIQVAVRRRSSTYAGTIAEVEQNPTDLGWESTRGGGWAVKDGLVVGELGRSRALLPPSLPLVVRDWPDTPPPTPGGIVWARHPEGWEVPALVRHVHVHARPECTTVEAETAYVGVITVYPHEVQPIGVTLAVGQRWQANGKPSLVLTVVAVTRGGLLADCRTPWGAIADGVNLFGGYTLMEPGAEQ